jgi:predicted alpha/beta hydrolase
VPQLVVAADGYTLASDRFHTPTPPRGIVIIAGAIGVPQRFYRRFASYVQQRGHQAVTFDYRGVARSAPRSLAGFSMDFRDWGRLDLAAMIETSAQEATALGVPLYVVGHSFGGHAFGMLPNHGSVRACFTYGTGAGWHGWMTLGERLKVLALWNVVGPLLTRWKGYLPWSMLGMGEDLPMGVYQQWRRWCRYPQFFFGDPEIGAEMREMFARVRTPILAASAHDDAWSPPRSRDAILTGYTHADVRTMDLDPRLLKTGPIGHMGFFRPNAASLWPAALDWLESAA